MGHSRRRRQKKFKKQIEKFTGTKLRSNSRHHIRPSSRGGSSNSDNIAMIDQHKHEIYHHIFINMTPKEIIKYLADYFWNGQWEHVERALQDHYLEGVQNGRTM